MRLKGYDYSQHGAYFVTVCAYQDRCIFGQIDDGEMIPNDLGRVVEEDWLRTEELRSNVELDAFVLMPNHLHGLIVMRDFLGHSEKPDSSTLKAGSLGAVIGQFKSVATKRIRRLPNSPDHPIWQRNYYESIIRTIEIWNRAREYIISNPSRWFEDSYYVA